MPREGFISKIEYKNGEYLIRLPKEFIEVNNINIGDHIVLKLLQVLKINNKKHDIDIDKIYENEYNKSEKQINNDIQLFFNKYNF